MPKEDTEGQKYAEGLAFYNVIKLPLSLLPEQQNLFCLLVNTLWFSPGTYSLHPSQERESLPERKPIWRKVEPRDREKYIPLTSPEYRDPTMIEANPLKFSRT